MKVSIDSRTIEPGDYFIPVKGTHFDGRDFIPEVVEKGGNVLDVDLFSYAKKYRKRLSAKVIAVVGSAGKTTVKDMLYSVLSMSFNVVKTHENQNNEFGVPLTLLAADEETEFLIVEMGLRKKQDLSFLVNIVHPDMVVFTGVGVSHMAFFDSPLQLANAKARVFRSALSWQTNVRTAFLCSSGAYHERICDKARKAGYNVVSYSGEDKVAENIEVCCLVGSFFGMRGEVVQQGIAAYKGSSHRMTVYKRGGVTVLDDSYNANPSGVLYALQYLRRFEGRKIVVLADMLELGAVSKKQHEYVAEWCLNEEVALLLLFGEEVKATAAVSRIPTVYFEDKHALSLMLKDELKDGDVVLIKGSRSMKLEKVVEDLLRALS